MAVEHDATLLTPERTDAIEGKGLAQDGAVTLASEALRLVVAVPRHEHDAKSRATAEDVFDDLVAARVRQ